MAAVLRGLSPDPFVFESLDGTPHETVLGDHLGTHLATDPVADQAFEAGRDQAAAESADRIAELEAETERLAAALAQAEQTETERADALRQSAEQLQALWARGLRALEPTLAALAIETAEAVLEAPLSDAQRAAAERALSDAVDHVAGEPPVAVSLHPIDLLHLQESGLAGAIDETHPGLRWEADSALSEGDWTVSTADAAVRRVRTAMVAGLRERLGLPSSS